jgi:hypothetical protein
MPRYYLHIRDGDRLVEDPDGSDLPDLDAARAEALESARNILAAKVKAGELIDDKRFEITDAVGTVLAVIPLKIVLRLADSDGSRPPIPTRSRPAFRFDVGHHSEMKPATR